MSCQRGQTPIHNIKRTYTSTRWRVFAAAEKRLLYYYYYYYHYMQTMAVVFVFVLLSFFLLPPPTEILLYYLLSFLFMLGLVRIDGLWFMVKGGVGETMRFSCLRNNHIGTMRYTNHAHPLFSFIEIMIFLKF